MATETRKLQGQLSENPQQQGMEVEKLLAGFLRALLDEQKLEIAAAAKPGSGPSQDTESSFGGNC